MVCINFSFDKFDRYNIPKITLCNITKEELSSISQRLIKNLIITPRFNAMSELSFSIYNTYKDDRTNNYSPLPYWNLLAKNRLIHVKSFGYFIITDIDTVFENNSTLKKINCLSYEHTLNSKNINILDGTYKFYNKNNPSDKETLMGQIMSAIPNWKLGVVTGDDCLWNKYRTFQVPISTIYGFLTTTVAKAYECIFQFNTETMTINVCSPKSLGKSTDIVLSFNNLLKRVNLKQNDNDIITALSVSGQGNLDIRNVNPLGGAFIYNFNHYTNPKDMWMSDNLIAAVKNWEDVVKKQEVPYGEALTALKKANSELLVLQAGLKDLEGQLKALEQVRTARMPYENNTMTSDTLAITNKEKEIAAKQLEIENKQKYINGIYDQLENINQICRFQSDRSEKKKKQYKCNKCTEEIKYDDKTTDLSRRWHYSVPLKNISTTNNLTLSKDDIIDVTGSKVVSYEYFDINSDKYLNVFLSEKVDTKITISYTNPNNFTKEQFEELRNFIFEGSYQNENFIKTKTMTPVEIQDMSKQLYDQGKNVLDKVSQPVYTFSIDTANFLFIKKFLPFIEQLKLGSTVNVTMEKGKWFEPALLEVVIDYDNPDNLKLTFANRYRLDSAEWTYADFQNQQSKTSNFINANSFDSTYPVKSKFVDTVGAYMNNSLIAANQEIVNSANNQEVKFGEYGIRLMQKKDDDPLIFDEKQCWLYHKGMAFTTDGWKSCKVFIGEVDNPTPTNSDSNATQKSYGLIADVLVGKLVAGNQLVMTNSYGGMTFDASGLTVKNDSTKIQMIPKNDSKADNAESFVISKKTVENGNETWTKQLSVNAGNLSLTGNVTCTNLVANTCGTIGGWTIDAGEGLQYTDVNGNVINYIRPNGNAKFGGFLTINAKPATGKPNATFNGNIYAKNLQTDKNIGDIVVNKETSDGHGSLGIRKFNDENTTRYKLGVGDLGISPFSQNNTKYTVNFGYDTSTAGAENYHMEFCNELNKPNIIRAVGDDDRTSGNLQIVAANGTEGTSIIRIIGNEIYLQGQVYMDKQPIIADTTPQ